MKVVYFCLLISGNWSLVCGEKENVAHNCPSAVPRAMPWAPAVALQATAGSEPSSHRHGLEP